MNVTPPYLGSTDDGNNTGVVSPAMWVRSEYAGELAVLSAWLSAVVPWNLTYSSFGDLGATLFVRFPFVQVQFTWLPSVTVDGTVRPFRQTGGRVIDGVWIADPVTAATAPVGVGRSLVLVSTAWAAGAAVLAVAVAVATAYYLREDRVGAGPVDPVGVIGALLCLGGCVLTVATALLVRSGLPGVPVPVGTVLVFALGYALLRAERTEASPQVDADLGD